MWKSECMKKEIKRNLMLSVVIGGVVFVNSHTESVNLNSNETYSYKEIDIENYSNETNYDTYVDFKSEADRVYQLRLALEAEEKRLAQIKAEKERLEKITLEKENLRLKELELKKEESKWVTYEASYYTAYCNGCSGLTKTGVNVKNTIYYNGLRIIAVDPRLIPLNSIVEIATSYGNFKAIAIDTGGAIKGHKIDVLVGSTKEALKLGRHNVKIKILKLGK